MNQLPHSSLLDVGALSRIFDSTSASYKFLLFKSILESIQSGNIELSFDDLALRSIAHAWYSIHFYKISYGHADRMTRWVEGLDRDMKDRVLISDMSYHHIYKVLKELDRTKFASIDKYINEFVKLVPYRLITPWFRSELVGVKDSQKNMKIFDLSQKDQLGAPYKLDIKDSRELILEMREEWMHYFKLNYSIINGWWSYHLLHYLQKRNPTVLSLTTKLNPPQERNMSIVKKLYKEFFKERADLKRCLYTGVKLNSSISHDHFLPWSFLGSDPLYNFAPTTRELNSSKSNIIPDKSLIPKMNSFQFEFFNFLRENSKKNALEFYLNDLKINSDVRKDEFFHSLERYYEPLYLTAENQGFEIGWRPS